MLSVIVMDEGGQETTMQFSDLATVAGVSSFLAAHSLAGVVGVNTIVNEVFTVTTVMPESNKGRRCVLSYVDHDGISRTAVIISPIGETEQTDEGERMTAVDGAAMATDHATACGYALPVAYVSGKIIDPAAL